MREAESRSNSSHALVALAWLVVSLPLAWGIYNTGLSAARLFSAGAPAQAATAPAPH